ncbi:hypothetical protein BV882_37630 [Streptomyces sp. 46]|nr:hypothetical protein BV882_37630 [Streptomyces sp. 46]
MITESGPVEIAVPRDRAGSFEPQLVKKRQRRLGGVDEMVLSLSAKELTHGEISAHLAEVYGAEIYMTVRTGNRGPGGWCCGCGGARVAVAPACVGPFGWSCPSVGSAFEGLTAVADAGPASAGSRQGAGGLEPLGRSRRGTPGQLLREPSPSPSD